MKRRRARKVPPTSVPRFVELFGGPFDGQRYEIEAGDLPELLGAHDVAGVFALYERDEFRAAYRFVGYALPAGAEDDDDQDDEEGDGGE